MSYDANLNVAYSASKAEFISARFQRSGFIQAIFY